MKKNERPMLLGFLSPIVLVWIFIFMYPTIRTLYMSFFEVKSLSAPANTWVFKGFDNYTALFKNPLFLASYKNILIIGFVGGIAVFAIALLFATVLSGKVKGKKLWRALVYLPNIITPVALVTMWTQYIYNNEYGMLHSIFKFLHLDALADIPWTSADWAFRAMLIAFCFGSVGYYMIIYMSAMERIPDDFYDYAALEGASKTNVFWKITFPLLRDTTRTAVTFWGIGAVNFFLWSRVFNVNPIDPTTIVPANIMFSMVFGSAQGTGSGSNLNVGGGCAVGVLLCATVIFIFGCINFIGSKETYEY